MSRINWSGGTSVPNADREVILEVESNFSGNKSNHFLERSFDLTLTNKGGKLLHHLVVNLKNATPDGYSGGRQYTCYLRYYYPSTASDATVQHLTPDRYPTDEKPNGMKLADGWLNIEVTNLKLGYGTYQVIIDYSTDLSGFASGHQIYWQKQAGTLSDKLHVVFQSDGKSYSADSDLSKDRLLIVSPEGLKVAVANPAAAHLPILGS